MHSKFACFLSTPPHLEEGVFSFVFFLLILAQHNSVAKSTYHHNRYHPQNIQAYKCNCRTPHYYCTKHWHYICLFLKHTRLNLENTSKLSYFFLFPCDCLSFHLFIYVWKLQFFLIGRYCAKGLIVTHHVTYLCVFMIPMIRFPFCHCSIHFYHSRK